MKKFILLLIVILLPTWSFAIELKILTEQYAPFNYKDGNRVTGFTTEIVEAILKETGNEHLKIRLYPWQRAYNMIQEEPNILLFTMTRSAKREKIFKWAGPVAERVQWMWKLKKRSDIKIKTLEDAKNYTISVVPESSVCQYLISQGFVMRKHLRPVPHGSLLLKKLLAGRNELHFDLKMGMAYRLKLLGKSMDLVEPILALPSTGDYFLAFSLGTPDSTVNLFQNTLDKLKSNGTFDLIKTKYMQ